MAKLATKCLVVAACLVAGRLGASALDGTGAADMSGLDSYIDETFDILLGAAAAEASSPPSPGLRVCAPGEAPADGVCRVQLKGKPEDAGELLKFLLGDKEAMKLWRDHFKRHVKDAAGDAIERLAGPEKPSKAAGFRTLAEAEFWHSRPAVSRGALAHLQLRMERLRLAAVNGGTEAEKSVTWEAEVSERFRFLSIKDAGRLMGTYLSGQANPDKPPVEIAAPLPPRVFSNFSPVEEKNFDAREAFPKCRGVIGHVRDQGDCGSCWAFASTEALNDRYCIKTDGRHREALSVQHTTSCCDLLHCLSFGCNGGQPRMAWRWMTMSGVVTGGDYSDLKTGKSCWPYEMPFCQHHSDGPYPKCDKVPTKTPKCRSDCEEEAYTQTVHGFKDDLHFASKSFSVNGRDEIKREIVDNGTLSGAFMVYEDFLMYKSGVYHHVTGMPLGGHAVKVIGFGVNEGVDYWLAVNSWNETWGDHGTFKIQMGDSGIDTEFCGGDAKPPTEPSVFLQQATQDL